MDTPAQMLWGGVGLIVLGILPSLMLFGGLWRTVVSRRNWSLADLPRGNTLKVSLAVIVLGLIMFCMGSALYFGRNAARSESPANGPDSEYTFDDRKH